MAKKGFDLAALAKSAMGDAAAASNLDTMTDIPAAQIAANSANFYEMSDLEELAGSIETVGLLHPVLVRPREGGGYTLIDGERRFRAMTEVLSWETVPCIVRQPVNAVVEELMLIEANRTQRKISASDLSKQAERYTELLAQLKDAGVEIPGRLRDRVAEALEVSASKLARLHAIRERLEPGLLELFDDSDLNESVAYELSKFDHLKQDRIWDALADANLEWTVENVQLAAERDDLATMIDPPKKLPALQKKNKAPEPVDDRPISEPQRRYSILRTAEALKLDPDRSLHTTIEVLKAGGRTYKSVVTSSVVTELTPKGVRLGFINSKNRKDYSFKEFAMILQELLWEREILGEKLGDKPVSNSDTAPAGLAWHDTLEEGPPPEGTLHVICWTVDGKPYKPLESMISEEFKQGSDTVCRWWAVVPGPNEED